MTGALLVAALLLPAPQLNESNVPPEVQRCVQPVSTTYAVSDRINPFYLRGDFDGDGRADYAVLVTRRSSGEPGIAVCRRRLRRPVVVWAGVTFNGSTSGDFDSWQVHEKGRVGQGAGEGSPPILLGDAILVIWQEKASGIIYWDGRRFRWYQQGD